MEYARAFSELTPGSYPADTFPRLFYLWGHSSEFRKDNNWSHLEALCQILSNQEDTWYATNMEIYNYTQAYNSLVFSAGSNRVYNPSLLDVWFAIDHTVYKIASGELLELDGRTERG